MRTRTITGIVMAIVLIPMLWLPDGFFFIIIGVLTMVASYEMVNVYGAQNPLKWPAYFFHIMGVILLYGVTLMTYLNGVNPLVILLAIMWILIIGAVAMIFSDSLSSKLLSQMCFSIIYIALAFVAISVIKTQGLAFFIYFLMLSMLTDMFAYYVGIRFGKHKLAPRISPKKTIEGAVGGTVIAVFFATLFGYFLDIFWVEQTMLPWVIIIVMGVTVSFSAQIGDLIASKIKRDHGVKDFSNLLPGHGGVMDRFDSTMFAALLLMFFLFIVEVIA